MSLAFLAKKSFNPANLKNAEKVWLAEQQHKEEQKRLAELKKQIQEERQQQELRDLQRASGHGGGKPVREKVDWMYSAPMATCETTADEYLLGKAAAPEQLGGSSGAQSEVKQLESKQLTGSKAVCRAVDDTFQRLHEDPLLAMRQREMEARQRVLSNPHQMNQLRQQAEQQRSAAAEERKRSRRELKKERKRHKKERKKEKKAQKKERKRERKRQRREGESEAGSRVADRHSKLSPRPRSASSNSDSSSDDDSDHGGGHCDVRAQAPTVGASAAMPRGVAAGYGLQNSRGKPLNTTPMAAGSGDAALGPSEAMLAKARRRESARGGGDGGSGGRSGVGMNGSSGGIGPSTRHGARGRSLTAEQKAALLAEMAADAETNEQMRSDRAKLAAQRKEQEAQELLRRAQGASRAEGSAAFIQELQHDAYIDKTGPGGDALAKRVQTQRHFQQRGDDEADGFRR